MDIEALRHRLNIAVYKKGLGLSLTDREIFGLYATIEGELMEMQKKAEQIQSFEDSVDSVLAELRKVMISKQSDYGPRNILNCGEKGVAVRANDKMARLLNLHGISDGSFQTKQAQNESIDDSWVDLANYGIIALMLRRGIFDRPLRGSK